MPDDDRELQEQKEEEEEEDSYVWDSDTQLYFHHRSGFYHDPNAGWYYCSKDGHYYKHENGEYVPLEYDESNVKAPVEIVTSEDDSRRKDALAQTENRLPIVENENEVSSTETPSEQAGCSNDRELEHTQRPSSWLEDTLIELYLAGNNQRPSYETACGADNQDYQMLSANGDDDAEELEEGEWIPEEDFDPQEDNFDEVAPSREEEIWQEQYGQVTESPESALTEISAVDLWDWKLVCESRKAGDEQVARLVGRLVRRSAKLHPSVASGGKVFKTAPICEARLHLVRVRTGQVYKLRSPSAKHLASLSVYDAYNPTKDWGFPDISNPETKRKAKKVKRKTDCKLTVKPQDEANVIEEQRSSSYRDRAAERRNLHGGYGVGPGQKGTLVGVNSDEDDDTICVEDAGAEALEFSFGSGSYARRIMGNMGWKQGETLGKNAKGLVEPIQAVGNTGNVGLGFPQRRRK
uniref:G-patch domain-containing protein n=1 Tax=Noccaea caerulescens TaxID=107243 RepID=A0A1J3CJE0_NOCCA